MGYSLQIKHTDSFSERVHSWLQYKYIFIYQNEIKRVYKWDVYWTVRILFIWVERLFLLF